MKNQVRMVVQKVAIYRNHKSSRTYQDYIIEDILSVVQWLLGLRTWKTDCPCMQIKISIQKVKFCG